MKILKKLFEFNDSSSILLKLTVTLSIAIMFMSVGFASLTSSLSINGTAKFVPVGMIRVMSIEQNTLTGVTEIEHSYTKDTIHVQIDIDEATGTAVYDVNITNLGQTDKVLTQIVDQIFTNNDIEYEITGLAIDDVIEAGESVDFQITFKYKDGVVNPDSRLNATIQFIFDDYTVQPTELVFRHDGACTFNGPGQNITGDECQEYWNTSYIDTGIPLYSDANIGKDYEIRFTIESYSGANQTVDQTVIVNAKHELGENIMSPGLVIRKQKKVNNKIEISQYFNDDYAQKYYDESAVHNVRIIRKNHKVYYSIDDAPLILLQDITDVTTTFDTTTWFGAAPSATDGSPMRNLKGTLSNLYVKLGTIESGNVIVNLDANGGTLDEYTITVGEGNAIGTLPVPTKTENDAFGGWYLDPSFNTPVDENYIPLDGVTLYAKWTSYTTMMDNTRYATLSEVITAIGTDTTAHTIELLDDLNDTVTIPTTANIILNLNNHAIRNSSGDSIITNNGTLKIVGGTISTNSDDAAAINNNSKGVLEIENVTVTASGIKQCLYNKGGKVTIKENSNFTSTSSSRAAVHNLSSGKMTILGGTIISENYNAIVNDTGTLVIGTKDGSINSTSPSIQGAINGVYSSPNYSFYDGIIKGKSNAVNNQAKITNIEDNSTITDGIDGDYKTIQLT